VVLRRHEAALAAAADAVDRGGDARAGALAALARDVAARAAAARDAAHAEREGDAGVVALGVLVGEVQRVSARLAERLAVAASAADAASYRAAVAGLLDEIEDSAPDDAPGVPAPAGGVPGDDPVPSPSRAVSGARTSG